MRNLLITIGLLVSGVQVNAQAVWNYMDGGCVYDYCLIGFYESDPTEHIIVKAHDTSTYTIFSDTVLFSSLTISENEVTMIMHTNEDGRIMSAPISELEEPVRDMVSLTTTGTDGAATYNPATGVFNIPNYSYTVPAPSSISSGGRNFNQAYQISSTRPSKISISSQISCSLTLSGGQAGNIQLQISSNGSTGWITVAQLTASNTGTLTIGLNTVQISGGQLVVELPIGYYWRATTNNTTGTPTYTFNGGFEIVY